jgi:hypothetical protein
VGFDMGRKRIFLVGRPGSEIHTVKRLLEQHPGGIVFPATDFFQKVAPASWLQRITGFVGVSARNRIQELFEDQLDGVQQKVDPYHLLSRRRIVEHFIESLDLDARRKRAKFWVEPSPSNGAHIDLIEDHLPDAKFVHVIDCPNLEATGEHLDSTLTDWLENLHTIEQHLDKPNHHSVRHNELLKSTRHTASDLFNSLRIGELPDLELPELESAAPRGSSKLLEQLLDDIFHGSIDIATPEARGDAAEKARRSLDQTAE